MITYNPMSKEFQDECKRLGLTGRQLTSKYQRECISLEKGHYKHHCNQPKGYTDEELLAYPKQYCKEHGKPPSSRDLRSYPGSPDIRTYIRRFGSWTNALKLIALDVDTTVGKGIAETNFQKARLSEIRVRDHFKQHPVDLAGENCNSPCDGICPNGKMYDVKSSKFYAEKRGFYDFHMYNKYKDDIEIYYLLGFNEDYSRLRHGWRIPGEIVEKDRFRVSFNNISIRGAYNIENMEEYNVTDKLLEILEPRIESDEDSD